MTYLTDILMIEDDPELGTLIKDFLAKEKFSVKLCPDAESGTELLEKEEFRLVLLDVMLPGRNGFETCSYIRSKGNTPVLMMSARDDEQSMLTGFETGADDYIGKPFSAAVLTAKIKAMLKRNGDQNETSHLSSHGITLDPVSRSVTKNGNEIRLNIKEFALLKCLMEHEGEAMTRDALFNEVWGHDCFTEPSTVSVHIRWLREKLEEDITHPELIKTVYKLGYRFGGE
ncbi:response regulator transcription factor [Ruminococcus sp. HUN007]|uniref:response regulator transcription factor n=1 Tax=Ruminococcus sp. HUN007 TaxID=1514668 RepID=UPI000AC8E098|nr:response regulator transcription factor [Ruminococcus sp. HUN007]